MAKRARAWRRGGMGEQCLGRMELVLRRCKSLIIHSFHKHLLIHHVL